MKEYYMAFFMSAFCAITASLLESLPVFIFALISLGFFIRGIVLLLPFPLVGCLRNEFHDAHPETVGMDRSDKETIFRSWKNKKNRLNQSSDPM